MMCIVDCVDVQLGGHDGQLVHRCRVSAAELVGRVNFAESAVDIQRNTLRKSNYSE